MNGLALRGWPGRRTVVVQSPAAPPALDPKEYEEQRTDVGALWLDRHDEVMLPYIKNRHTWEENEGALLRALIRPGTRFLDVGANVGYFSLLAARAAHRVAVDAVEPHPGSVMALRWNLWANGVRACVHQLALDDRRRRLVLEVSPTNVGDSRVGPGSGSAGAVEVTAVPADELFAGRGFDVVKVDVQGWEPEVVRGMRRIIARSHGIALVVEFWPAALRDRGLDPLSILDLYHRLELDMVTQVDANLRRLSDNDIVDICDDAGPYGQVNLLLRRA